MADLPINYGDTGRVAREKINDSYNALLEQVEGYEPHIVDGIWWIGETNTGVKAEGDHVQMKVEGDYIRYKSDTVSWTTLILLSDLKGPQGDQGDAATITVGSTVTGAAGTSASVENVGSSSEAVLKFVIPAGAKGDPGEDGEDGEDGESATIEIGTTTTGEPGTDASVTNSGTSSAAVLNFTIPEGAKGEPGEDGEDGNGIASITSSKSGKITTVTITETNGDSDTFQISDGEDGQGAGDVLGPSSSADGNVVLFDGTTGKLIKDSGVGLSSKLDASALSDNNYGGAWENDSTHTPTKRALYDKIHTMDVEIGNKAADNTVVKLTGNQTINGTKTFGTSPVVPSKTSAATNTGTAIATEAQVYNVSEDVATINGKIPSAATSSNQLADKNYVDDSINSVTAYYITKNAQGDQWATYAELAAATTFYSGGVARTPTRNDYTIVLADENHDNATTRYIYNSGWEYQYTVNETALSQAQLDALNSGITSGKVSTYDGYATTISGKQDALTLPSTPTQGNLVVRGANNKTIADGGAIPTGVPSGGNNGDVLTNVSGTPTWVAPSGVTKSSIQVTLTTAGWSSNTQTVSATGVTATNDVIVSPAPSDIADYADCGVYCSAQASGTLTFGCDTAPSGDIVVNVLIMS